MLKLKLSVTTHNLVNKIASVGNARKESEQPLEIQGVSEWPLVHPINESFTRTTKLIA